MPLLWISLFFTAGLVLKAGIDSRWPSTAGWLLITGGLVAAWPLLNKLPPAAPWLLPLRWVARRHPQLRLPPLILLACLAAGAAHYSAAMPNQGPGTLLALNDQGSFRLVGVVSSPPEFTKNGTSLRVTVESASRLDASGGSGPAQEARGLLFVQLAGRSGWQYGDRLVLSGRLGAPPDGDAEDGGFSYRAYLARHGIYSYMAFPLIHQIGSGAGSPLMQAIYHLRGLAYHKLYELFPAPEAPLLAGILLGIEYDLTQEVEAAFRDTGTAHIIAISGFNIALLVGLFSTLFNRLVPRWWAAALAALGIAVYTLLVGAQPSVVRAAIMGSLGLLGALLGRRSSGLAGLNTLAFTAALMCLANPFLPWNASFQLSFSATLGLMLYAGPLQRGFERLVTPRLGATTAQRLAGPVGEYLLFTLAAQAVTLPVILAGFQRFSLSALLANPLILPAQPLLMILGGLAVVAGLLFDPLGRLLAMLAWPLAAYTLRVVEAFAQLPGGVVTTGRLSSEVVILLALLVLAPFFASLAPAGVRQWLKAQLRPGVVLVTAGLAAAFLMRTTAALPDGRLHLTVINAESHPVLLIQFPAGNLLLTGGSPGAGQVSEALGRRLPPLDHHLDALIITDCTNASLQQLPLLLQRHPLERAWWACPPPGTRAADQITLQLTAGGVETGLLKPGEALAPESGAVLQTIAGDDSATLTLTWENFRAVVPAGAAPDQFARLSPPGLLVLTNADLETAAAAQWEALEAQAVIWCGDPAAALTLPARWLTLPHWGWAQAVSDGEKMWVEKGK